MKSKIYSVEIKQGWASDDVMGILVFRHVYDGDKYKGFTYRDYWGHKTKYPERRYWRGVGMQLALAKWGQE